MGKTDRTELFESLPVRRAVAEMAIPTIFSQIIVLIYNMADTFYLGRAGNPYMVAGVSLILPAYNICLSLAGLTGGGAGPLISRLLGVGREEEAKKVSAFAFYQAIALTALFSVLVFLFMTPVLRLLGASANTLSFARQYTFCVIVLGGVPTVLSNVMANLLRSVGVSRQAGFGITMGGVLNIGLDPLFMFVLLPAGNEVLGVGIATLLSNCVACVYFFLVIRRMRNAIPVCLSVRAGLPSGESIRSALNVGIPSAVATLLFDIDYIFIDKLMAGYGDIALAAMGIVLKVERLPLNVGIGICQGMLPIVAYNHSSRNIGRMKATIRFSIAIGLIVSAVSIALYEIFAGGMIRFFISDPQTVALGAAFLRIRCLATPLMFMSFFTVYVFQAFGKGNTALFLGVMRWAVFNIPMMLLLNHLFGMYGIVWTQVCADIVTVSLSAVTYIRYDRSRR